MRIVLTGATSFIGRAVLNELLAGGHQVFAVVRPGSPGTEALEQAAKARGLLAGEQETRGPLAQGQKTQRLLAREQETRGPAGPSHVGLPKNSSLPPLRHPCHYRSPRPRGRARTPGCSWGGRARGAPTGRMRRCRGGISATRWNPFARAGRSWVPQVLLQRLPGGVRDLRRAHARGAGVQAGVRVRQG